MNPIVEADDNSGGSGGGGSNGDSDGGGDDGSIGDSNDSSFIDILALDTRLKDLNVKKGNINH